VQDADIKRTESLLNEHQLQLQEKERQVNTLESSLVDKNKELAAMAMPKDGDNIRKGQEEFEHQRETSVRGEKLSQFNSDIWIRMQN
jgi:hypothetical protein